MSSKANTAIKQEIDKFYKECEIDPRTLPLIVNHFVSIGKQAAERLTSERILEIHAKTLAEEKEAEAQGKVRMITADFESYILNGCKGLAALSHEARCRVIRQNI